MRFVKKLLEVLFPWMTATEEPAAEEQIEVKKRVVSLEGGNFRLSKEIMGLLEPVISSLPQMAENCEITWFYKPCGDRVVIKPGLVVVEGRTVLPEEERLALLERAGIKEIEVELPEEVIYLPPPEWVTAHPYAWPNNTLQGFYCFRKEAVEQVSSLCQEIFGKGYRVLKIDGCEQFAPVLDPLTGVVGELGGEISH